MTDTQIPIPEYQGFLKENSVTIAEVLQEAGYETLMSGKWHLGEEKGHWPNDRGFDTSFALINGASSYFDFQAYRSELWPPGNNLKVVRDDKVLDMSENKSYATDLYTNTAINMIKEHSEGMPFFLYLSYTAPHWPLHALPEDIQRYEGRYDAGWNAVREKRFERLKQLKLIDPEARLSELMSLEEDWNGLSLEEQTRESKLMEVYAAMVDRLDQNVGQLFSALEETGHLNNTVIIFLSDNGAAPAGNLAASKYSHPRFDPKAEPGTPTSFTGYGKSWANVSNAPFREFKSNIHEGGIATPFIIWHPSQLQQGKILYNPVHIMDVMPTLVDIGQGNYPKVAYGRTTLPMEGRNLMPILKGEQQSLERPLFFEHEGNRGLIMGNWKLVGDRDREWELYNLATDRSETRNLADKHIKRVREMKLRYAEWASDNKVLPYDEVKRNIPFKF